MTIELKEEALEYYVLASLSLEDLYGAQILQKVAPYLTVNQADLYAVLTKLENEGKITKKLVQESEFRHYNLCSITPSGRKYVETFMKELNRKLPRYW